MSGRRLDHVSRWTELYPIDGKYSFYRCECGTEKQAIRAHVQAGRSASCGCLRQRITSERRTTHALSKSKEYSSWCKMKERCSNPGLPGAEHWLGRGIEVCVDWRDSFEQFYADMGACPPDKSSIDRIDTNGNYEPGNCRWASNLEQMNNMTSNVHMEVNGVKMTVAEAARSAGLKYATVYRRFVIRGECPAQALRAIQ